MMKPLDDTVPNALHGPREAYELIRLLTSHVIALQQRVAALEAAAKLKPE